MIESEAKAICDDFHPVNSRCIHMLSNKFCALKVTGRSLCKLVSPIHLDEQGRSLRDAQIGVLSNLYSKDVPHCPCCKQPARTYRRKFNSSMAFAIIAIHRGTKEEELVHLFKFLRDRKIQHSDAPLLRFWGLIDEMLGPKEDGNPRTGVYKITSRGRAFAEDSIKIAGHVICYNQDMLSLDEREFISIRDCIGDDFRYDELMNA